MPEELSGTYAGIVSDVNDPSKVGRVKVYVPTVHGQLNEEGGSIPAQLLPWAFPAGIPSGGQVLSGGISWLPIVGDQVWVRFLDGQPEKPIWEWANQNIYQRDNWGPLNKYDKAGPVARGAISRYDHWIEFLETQLNLYTKQGYTVNIKDGDTGSQNGSINLFTPRGGLISLDDKSESCTISVKGLYTITEEINSWSQRNVTVTTPLIQLYFGTTRIGGNYPDFYIDGVTDTLRGLKTKLNALSHRTVGTTVHSAKELHLTTNEQIVDPVSNNPIAPTWSGVKIKGQKTYLAVSLADNGDPVVRMSDLKRALSQVKLWMDTHVHGGVKGGPSISGPPILKMVLAVTGSSNVRVEKTSVEATVVK